MPGTDEADRATRCPVLTSRIVCYQRGGSATPPTEPRGYPPYLYCWYLPPYVLCYVRITCCQPHPVLTWHNVLPAVPTRNLFGLPTSAPTGASSSQVAFCPTQTLRGLRY
eukprot:2914712-Rhodomonas_salina.2